MLESGTQLDDLERALQTGDFGNAVRIAHKIEVGGLEGSLQVRELLDPDRVRMVGCMSEIDFYLDRKEKAWKRLESYLSQWPALCELPGVSAQVKLQVGMYHHTKRDFDHAVKVGEMVKEKCQEGNSFDDNCNVGLCCYYQARFTARQDKFPIIEYYCDHAVKYITQAAIDLIEDIDTDDIGPEMLRGC